MFATEVKEVFHRGKEEMAARLMVIFEKLF